MATLLEIRDRCYQRADRINETQRYPNSEVDQYINDSYKELWAILVRHSLIIPEAQDTITADGSSSYDAPSDWFATLTVWRQEGSDQYYRLKRHNGRNRPFGTASTTTGSAYSYRTINESTSGVLSKQIELYPLPQTGTYIHVYVPIPATLALDADSLDSVLGWDEYIVNDVAIKMLLRENSEVGQFMQIKSLVLQRIRDEAEMQEMTEAYNIEDTRTRFTPDPGDYRWARDGDY